MKRSVIQLMIITLCFAPINTFYVIACCSSQAIELDDDTIETNQQLARNLNIDEANCYIIDLKQRNTTNILRFHTRTDRKFWTVRAADNGKQVILIETRPIIEGYRNNDQILCQSWQVIGLKKGTTSITFQERKGSKVISEIVKTITVLE